MPDPDPSAAPDSLAELATLGELLESNRPRLLATLQRRMDPALARRVSPEDVLAQAFLSARQRWAAFRRQSALAPYPWLYRQVLDCLWETWRRETRECRDLHREMPWPEQSSVQLGLSLIAPGTPEYMAPEQWRGTTVDGRTDVWGLGVTLYELLTLRRAFAGASGAEIRGKVLDQEPTALEPAPRGLPRDLAAICRKALQKDSARRYASARDFAEDLKRWLRGEPTAARPGWVLRRVGLWARRNKGWAVLLGGMLLAGAGLAVAAWAMEKSRRDLAEADAATAQAQERERRREALMVELQLVRLRARTEGWSEKAWELVRAAAELRRDSGLRDQAAATFIGLDTARAKRIPGDAGALLFDPTEKRLLIGGAHDLVRGVPREPARLWQTARPDLVAAPHAGDGPVAFAADGTALHVLVSAQARHVLELWDVVQGKKVRDFELPGGKDSAPTLHRLALTPDAGLLAASARLANGTNVLVVWEAATGKLLRQELDLEQPITALAVHPRAEWVATGGARGRLALYPVKEKGGPAVVLPAPGRVPVGGLALHQAAGPRDADGRGPWLLAVGEFGGRLTVWDLRQRIPQTFCHGSSLDLAAVCFSPDGTLLASGARYHVKFWDVATGRELLNCSQDRVTDVAFAPDGSRLAASAKTVFGGEGSVTVWELEDGRGIRTFRGLVAPLAHVQLSAKGKYLAALADDWQVAVWQAADGKLVHLWNGPRGNTSDHAALAFSRDESLLAVATYQECRVWDLTTGKVWKTLALPPGLHDALAFDAAGKRLLSCRLETRGGMQPPFGNVDLRVHPLVVRLRDLLAADPKQALLAECEDFHRRLHTVRCGREGGPFAVLGEVKGGKGPELHLKVFDGATGRELWSTPSASTGFAMDPLGRVLFLPGEKKLVAAATGKGLALWEAPPGEGPSHALSPDGELGVTQAPHHGGIVLNRRADGATVLVLGMDGAGAVSPVFSEDGRWLAWGGHGGSVLLADLPEVQRRLARADLGW
jgi:WD40 repeat protein